MRDRFLVLLGLLAFVASCGGETNGSGEPDANLEGDAAEEAGPEPCQEPSDCDDGRFCNGAETCEGGFCQDGDEVECGDGIDCTVDLCSETEDECVSAAPDLDGDGKGDAACLAEEDEPLGEDCDDEDANRFPGNVEVCDVDHHDEDCDPETYGRVDSDDDTFYSAACCNDDGEGGENCGTDCDDVRGSVNPNATETCDAFDNDCDGDVDDEVGVALYPDSDRDGHGDSSAESVLECADAVGFVNNNDDCDDVDPTRHAAQVEICDGKDNDCDVDIDEVMNFVTWYRDLDGDTFGKPSSGTTESCVPPVGYSLLDSDCDDAAAAVSPLAAEACDGKDNDCNGLKDFQVGVNDLEDDDDDGLIDLACPPLGTDCDDTSSATGAGSDEICDGRDNDCDDIVDEGADDAVWYVDNDGDGYGSATSGTILSCQTIPGYTRAAGDCNDNNADRSPGADELCNLSDDDCDSAVDESPSNDSCTGVFHATAKCVLGQCVVDSCDDGYGDCSGGLSNGCETQLGTSTNCTGCGDRCTAPGGVAQCIGGDCKLTSCIDLYDDCDDNPETGCETSLATAANCGGCGNDCDFAGAHGTGGCDGILGCQVVQCDMNYDDCEPDAISACETNVTNDESHCGQCGNNCNGPMVTSATCSFGSCSINSCMGDFENCNGSTFDGCETDTDMSTQHCGACNNNCNMIGPANWMCDNGTCEVASCTGQQDDCNMSDSDGCETNTDNSPMHCGACGNNCGTSVFNVFSPRCMFGDCDYDSCQFQWGDCDTNRMNGCETPTGSDEDNCGACGIQCAPGSQCSNATCEQVAEIAVGAEFTCARFASGFGVACWGDNTKGQLGSPGGGSEDQPVALAGKQYLKIAAGAEHACGITLSGFVECWGSNSNGQIGNSSVTLGTNATVPTNVTGIPGGMAELTLGDNFSCAGTSFGEVYCWGSDSKGQIGNGSTSGDVITPYLTADGTGTQLGLLNAGGDYVWARSSTEMRYRWGSNDNLQHQLDVATTLLDVPTFQSAAITNVQIVRTGGQHGCWTRMLFGSSVGQCWGANSDGQLGSTPGADQKDPVNVIIGGGGALSDFFLGKNHSCAVKGNDIYCWGDNQYGQVAQTPPSDVSFPGIVSLPPATPPSSMAFTAVSRGPAANHTCVARGSEIYCWGNDSKGQLGRGSSPNANQVPTLVDY